ncbi:hypothetical protein [Butyricicoccus sp. Marseille-Q5471]|uniref:hypothetical protein n=1 Tax=Butyricicoccus sp. Marseille-Q5471 TaxID=3039493 RepID=UPI0024BC5100|nr:hypothetical protein [Butyricicoccus sp. Marseille-Q5471]
MAQYVVTEKIGTDEIQFGIAVWEKDEMVDHIADIAPTMTEVMRLAALLQRCGVASEQFRDVVLDYIVVRA